MTSKKIVVYAFFAATSLLEASSAFGETSGVLGYQVFMVADGVRVETGNPSTDPKPFQWTFNPSDFRVVAVLPNARAEVSRLVAAAEGRQITVAGVFSLAQSIEDAHKRAGYPLARIVIPDQVLRSHKPVIIQVVDVRVGKVVGRNLPPAMGQSLIAQSAAIVEKPMPTAQDLATFGGLAQFEFGQNLTLETAEASRRDRVDLVAKGPTSTSTSEISASSILSKLFHVTSMGAATTIYGAFSQGERTTLAASWAQEHDSPDSNGPAWSLSISGSAPLSGSWGGFFEFAASAARYSLDAPVVNSSYEAKTVSVGYASPLFFGTQESAIVRFGAHLTDEHENATFSGTDFGAFSAPFTTVDARASIDWVKLFDSKIKIEAGAEIRFGETRTSDSSLLSSATTLYPIGLAETHAKATVPIAFGLVGSAYGKMAMSFLGPLPPSAQTQLLQTSPLAPVDPRTIEGDSGSFVRLEVMRDFQIGLFDRNSTIEPYGFIAGGIVYQQQMPSVANPVSGTAAGFGVRTTIPTHGNGPSIEGAIEVSRQNSSSLYVPNYSSITISAKVKF